MTDITQTVKQECPSCGANITSVNHLIKKKLGVFCDRCLKFHYTTCDKCLKTKQNRVMQVYRLLSLRERLEYPIMEEGGYTKMCKVCYQATKKSMRPISVSVCDCCGDLYQNLKIDEDTNKKLCDKCLRRKFTCLECGKIGLRAGREYAIIQAEETEGYLCNECAISIHNGYLLEKITTCIYCGCLCTKEHGTEAIEGQYLCYNCAVHCGRWQCTTCRRVINEENLGDKKPTCLRCRSKEKGFSFLSITCPKCGDPYVNDNVKIKNNKILCRKCAYSSITGSAFNRYNYVPRVYYLPKTHETLLIGTEHEYYDTYTADIKNIKEKHFTLSPVLRRLYTDFNESQVYVKFDGSIKNRQGWEVVTHPMLYKDLMALDITKFPFNYPRELSCGMHVHLSKKFFDRPTLYKFIKFIYDYDRFIIKIAERSPVRGQCDKLPHKEYIVRFAMNKKNEQDVDKHTQVNLKHKETVEIRIFAQATSSSVFKKNIQFCVSLAYFCKDTAFKRVNLNNFVSYVFKNTRMYPELASFLSTSDTELWN